MIENAVEAMDLIISQSGNISNSILDNAILFVMLENDNRGEHVLRATRHGKYFVRSYGKWFSEDHLDVPFDRSITFCMPESRISHQERKKLQEKEQLL